MSTTSGVAAITEALRALLSTAVQDVRDARVTVGPPSAKSLANSPTVNLFLYRVRPNPQHRNSDLPHGAPTVAIDLEYLISFSGEDNELEPELMLGAVLAELHSHPMLTEDDVNNALRQSPMTTRLDAGSLAEPINLFPLSLSNEERSRLWSVFFQVPYRLSIECGASVLLITAGPPPLRPGPPKSVQADVAPMAEDTNGR